MSVATRMTKRLIVRAVGRSAIVFAGYIGTQLAVLAATGSPVWAALGGAAFTIPAYLLVHSTTGGWAAKRLLRVPRQSVWLWVLGLGVVWLGGQTLGLLLMEVFPESTEAYARRVEELAATPAVLTLTLTLLAAPVSEELLMRGVLYGEMRRSLRLPVWLAVSVSAVVFAVMHGNLLQIGTTLTLGAFLALAYEYTRSIWVPITLHGLFNVLSTFVPVSVVTPLATPLYVCSLNLVVLAGIAWLCAARSN